ncbi:hypothetical protein QQ045_023213 [Rhodiola kirilowii]
MWQKGHYARTCWVKQKINNLNEDERIKGIISKILLNSDESSESELTDFSSTSEDLKILRNETVETDSESEWEPCMKGRPCQNKDSDNEEALYKMQSQFQELKINMLSFKIAMELIEDIKDPESRLKIIDKRNAVPKTSKSQEVHREIVNPKPYLMNEVYRRIRQKTKVEKPNSTHDLIIEIGNLKKEIQDIKTNNRRLDQRISRIEKGKEVITSTSSDIKEDKHFLSTLEMFITKKWHINIALLIDNYYSKEFTALVDSGADLNVIQEGLIPTRYFHKIMQTLSLTALVDSGADLNVIQEVLIPARYFHKTTHTLSHAGGITSRLIINCLKLKYALIKNVYKLVFYLLKILLTK